MLAPAAGGPHYVPEDQSGTYINVVRGLRRTTDQPPNPARRILMFGGPP